VRLEFVARRDSHQRETVTSFTIRTVGAHRKYELRTSGIQVKSVTTAATHSVPQSVLELRTTVANLKILTALSSSVYKQLHTVRSIKQKRRDLRSIVWFVRIPPSIGRHTRSSFVSQHPAKWRPMGNPFISSKTRLPHATYNARRLPDGVFSTLAAVAAGSLRYGAGRNFEA
jgi:hypothetical protein